MTICACVPWEQLDEKKNGQERDKEETGKRRKRKTFGRDIFSS